MTTLALTIPPSGAREHSRTALMGDRLRDLTGNQEHEVLSVCVASRCPSEA